nr:MAG TPA: hypothetical protein [Caudoviricetes sp.]
MTAATRQFLMARTCAEGTRNLAGASNTGLRRPS